MLVAPPAGDGCGDDWGTGFVSIDDGSVDNSNGFNDDCIFCFLLPTAAPASRGNLSLMIK